MSVYYGTAETILNFLTNKSNYFILFIINCRWNNLFFFCNLFHTVWKSFEIYEIFSSQYTNKSRNYRHSTVLSVNQRKLLNLFFIIFQFSLLRSYIFMFSFVSDPSRLRSLQHVTLVRAQYFWTLSSYFKLRTIVLRCTNQYPPGRIPYSL